MTRRTSLQPQPAAPPTIPKIPPADVLGRLAALQGLPTAALKQQWQELFSREPPPFNRSYIQSRLAYRIQELAYGGLKPAPRARLEALGEQLDGRNVVLRRIRADSRPLPGTRLVREYDRAHAILQTSPRLRVNQNRQHAPALLKGLIFGVDGRALSPTHSRKNGRLYRYYVAQRVLKGDAAGDDSIVRRVSAAEIETAVVDQVRVRLRQPEVVVGTWRGHSGISAPWTRGVIPRSARWRRANASSVGISAACHG